MAKMIGELTVGVNLSIEEETAKICLKIVEMYVNQKGADIVGHKDHDGRIVYHFEYGFGGKQGIEPKEE